MERRKFVGALPLLAGGALALRASDVSAQTTSTTPINVKSYGAVGNGVTDDSAALQNAINVAISANASVFVPAGQYVHGPLTATGGTLKMFGEGRENSVFLLNSAGSSITFTNSNSAQFRDMGFGIHGSPQSIAGTNGPTMSTDCDGSQWWGCNFIGFAGSGLVFSGSSSSGQSSHQVMGCGFVGSGGAQLSLSYSSDFHIVDNQFGMVEGCPYATIGCELSNAGAGTYKGNYHWQNVIGFKATSANYLRVIGNRFEQSNQQGVYMQDCVDVIFSDNTIHTNSQSESGAYDNVYFSNMNTLIVSNNNSFDWTGGASFHRWGINIDTLCADVSLCKNKCSGYSSAFGPIRIDGTVIAGVSPDTEFVGCTSATVPAGTATYLGINGAQDVENATLFVVTRKCTIQSFLVDSDVAPGNGQTFTYTLRVNLVNTSMTGSSTGTASWTVGCTNSAPSALLKPGDVVSILLNTSFGAAAAHHRYFVALSEY